MQWHDARLQTLVATILGSSMAFIDSTVVNVALVEIGGDLDLSLAGRQWVFLAYSLAIASLYLIAGGVGDRIGERKVFAAGVVGFAIASALAGAASDGPVLIAARALQGVAGAFLTNGSLALLRSTYGRESGRAVGTWTAWTGISVLVGPPLGGAIVEYSSWRLIFLINLPLALVTLLLVRRSLVGAGGCEANEPVRRPFDAVGALLLALGLGSLTYALVEGPERGAGAVWWAIVAAAVGLVGGGFYESRRTDPLLPLSLFRVRNFAAANAITLLVYAALGGSTFFLVQYLQSVIGYSPLESSLVLVPISLLMLALAGRFGQLADRHGPRAYLTLGPALLAAGMLLWALVSDRDRVWALVAGVVVFGIGLAITVAPITATALTSAPTRFAGIAAGVNNTVARTGSLVAVALLGLVITLVYDAGAPGSARRPLTGAVTTAAERSASIDAFHAAMLVAAGLAAVGALIAVLAISNAGAQPRAEHK